MKIDDLIRRLGPLAKNDTRNIAQGDRFSFVSAFVARQTETIQSIALPVASLLVVVEGVKTVVWAGRTFTYPPGTAFALPAGTAVDVVNEPDPKSGVYRAVFLGFSGELLDDARRRWSSLAAGPRMTDPTVAITPALASAVLHAGEALAGMVEVSARVKEQRIQEILLILAECGAAPLRPDMKTWSTAEAARQVVRGAPARGWTVDAVARELATSEPTLRRHLRQEGAGFRKILAEERMRAARAILMEGRGRVAEAAVVSGYASLSHFAKQFRTTYGYAPSEIDTHAE